MGPLVEVAVAAAVAAEIRCHNRRSSRRRKRDGSSGGGGGGGWAQPFGGVKWGLRMLGIGESKRILMLNVMSLSPILRRS